MGQIENILNLLKLTSENYEEDTKALILSEDHNGMNAFETALHYAWSGKAMAILIHAASQEDTLKKLMNHVLIKQQKNDKIFANVDSDFWDSALGMILERIDEHETKIKNYKKESWKLSDDNQLGKLQRYAGEESSKLDKYLDIIAHLVSLLSKKNQFDYCAFYDSELLDKNIELLDKLHWSECYTYSKTLQESSTEECFPSFWYLQENNIPFSEASLLHPLTVIAESEHLPLIKHPIVQIYVDICWSSLARYVFYTNLILYFSFFSFLTAFITSHSFSRDPVTFSSVALELTEVCRYATLLLSVLGLLFEVLQMWTKRKQYWTQIENWADLFIFVTTLLLLSIEFAIDYNTVIHSIGCGLIVISAFRGAWILTHLPYLGNKFRMLFSVLTKVFTHSPILLFFILTFALVYYNLLQNQETFSHI